MPQQFTCAVCGAAISRNPWRPNTSGAYCSRQCYYASQRVPLTDRFWPKVDKSGDCWLWTAHRNMDRGGYGEVGNENGQTEWAHRVAWRLINGPIPAGMKVCHTCDNPPCVKADTDPMVSHLFLATDAGNVADKVSKGRQNRGETSPVATLTTEIVRAIRARYSTGGESYATLARAYGVNPSTIGKIVTRERWKHV